MHELLKQIVEINAPTVQENKSEANFKQASEFTRNCVALALEKTIDTLRPDNKPENHKPK